MNIRGAAAYGIQQQFVDVADDWRVFDVVARYPGRFGLLTAGDLEALQLHALVVAKQRRVGFGALDGLVDHALELVVLDDHGVHAQAGLELDLVDGVQVGGVRHAEEQALAAPEHGQYAVLGQQLVGDQPGDVQVDGQGVQVEQRHAELAGGGLGDIPRPGGTGPDQLRDEVGFLVLGGGERRLGLFLADDPVLHQTLRQAGEPAAVADIGH